MAVIKTQMTVIQIHSEKTLGKFMDQEKEGKGEPKAAKTEETSKHKVMTVIVITKT